MPRFVPDRRSGDRPLPRKETGHQRSIRMTTPSFDMVVPTAGRPQLDGLLTALARARGTRPRRLIVVDDRRDRRTALPARGVAGWVTDALEVLPGPAGGPAAARNAGWRASSAEWIAFCDDDVVPPPDWLTRLA